jgi:alanyl-tRNA synthetase
MQTTKLTYLDEPNQLTTTATVLGINEDQHGHWLELDKSVFHVKGGGQKADSGTIDSMVVQEVVNIDSSVRHYVDVVTIAIGDNVDLVVDCAMRDLHTRWHSAGHLIASVAESILTGFKADRSHQYPGEGWVGGDYIGSTETVDVSAINAALKTAISGELPVAATVSSVRTVQMGSYGAIACGGTHVTNTASLTGTYVTKVKAKKGRLKLSYTVT